MPRNQPPKRRIRNGHLISDDTWNVAFAEAKNVLKYRMFASIWQFVFSVIIIPIVSRSADNIVKIFFWVGALIAMFYLYGSYGWLQKKFGWQPLSSIHPLLWVIIAFICFVLNRHEITLVDHEGRIKALEIAVIDMKSQIKYLDNGLTALQSEFNDTMYSPLIQDYPWANSVDIFVRKTIFEILGQAPLTRQAFGLGCFMKGSQIQIDKYGNVRNVEQLRNGDFVYNPVTNEQVSIHTFIIGYESGYMYRIMTNDSMSVSVTETHPMKICRISDAYVFDCDNNVAAKDVGKGNWTLTKNGYQQIVSIEAIAVDNTMVYNFMLNVTNDTLISHRAVIANGIYSLDLYAQQEHH